MKCVMIMSPPRSGSSCLAGCLLKCGLHPGKTPTTDSDKWNLKGYFENDAVLKCNSKLIKAMGVPVFCRFKPKQADVFPSVRQASELRAVLEEEFTESPFLIKCCRTAILQRVYRRVLHDMGVEVKVVILVRDQEATARSLWRFAGGKFLKREQFGSQVWETYRSMLVDVERDFDAIHINFSELMGNPFSTISAICNFAGLASATREELAEFVEPLMVTCGGLQP